MQNLYEEVSNVIQYLDAKQGDPTTQGDDQRTELEKRLHPLLWDVWEVLRLHPAVQTTTPDENEDVVEIRAVTPAERKTATKEMREMLREGLRNFLLQSKVKKKHFAAIYGDCQPAHVSNMLAGRKAVNIASFMSAVSRLGWEASIKVQEKKILFTKAGKPV